MSVKILEENYAWAYYPSARTRTTEIILHHAAASSASAGGIHSYHLSLGWAGIAYHYYVRKDGAIYRGRPEDWQGGHTANYNSVSIGVCFEGNFDSEDMPTAQFESGKALLMDILTRYPDANIGPHSSYNATNCPGGRFPLEAIIPDLSTATAKVYDGNLMEADVIYRTIDDVPKWGRNTIQKLIDRELLKGDGDTLNIGYQMLRVLVINDRACLYDKV